MQPEAKMTISELLDLCYSSAKKNGWTQKPVPIPEQVALICSEACEGLEAWRNNEPTSWTDKDGKPQGLGSEYADVIIRIAHYCVIESIDLEWEIKRKLLYNDTRSYRHGNKRA
jgi:NTP pyrophosphatase (non-canonical NTP hydrolase)